MHPVYTKDSQFKKLISVCPPKGRVVHAYLYMQRIILDNCPARVLNVSHIMIKHGGSLRLSLSPLEEKFSLGSRSLSPFISNFSLLKSIQKYACRDSSSSYVIL